jgi:signal peptidase I
LFLNLPMVTVSILCRLVQIFLIKEFFFSSPERGDVVVFKTPEDNDTDYIKRLIGLPGDKIQMINSVLHINNKPIKRDFVKNDFVLCGGTKIKSNFYLETLPNGKTYLAAYAERNSSKDTDVYLIPENKFFFMGDNRDCSQDSRYLSSVGYVDKLNLVGKAQILFFRTMKKLEIYLLFGNGINQ